MGAVATASATKRCTRCGLDKSVEDFYWNSCHGIRKRQYQCKACHNLGVVARRKQNPEKELARRRKVEEDEARNAPYKLKARLAVRRAVASGKMVRPEACESCGGTQRVVQGHHPDYAEPLRVEWLCPKCHGEEHARLRALASEGMPEEASS